MSRLSFFLFVSILALSCAIQACRPDMETNDCFTCKYTNPLPQDCMDSYHIDMCILGPHEQSSQLVLSIEIYCNGVLTSTRESITFPAVFFEEQANAGGMCEQK